MTLAIHNSFCPFVFLKWFPYSCSLYLHMASVMVCCCLEFHFLKEQLFHSYCYKFFLICLLFFFHREKICLLDFNVFSSSYSQQPSFLRSLTQKALLFASLTFQKSAFFFIPSLLCFSLPYKLTPCVITTFKLPAPSEFSTSSSLFKIRSSSLASSSKFCFWSEKLITLCSTILMGWWGAASLLFPLMGSWDISTE